MNIYSINTQIAIDNLIRRGAIEPQEFSFNELGESTQKFALDQYGEAAKNMLFYRDGIKVVKF